METKHAQRVHTLAVVWQQAASLVFPDLLGFFCPFFFVRTKEKRLKWPFFDLEPEACCVGPSLTPVQMSAASTEPIPLHHNAPSCVLSRPVYPNGQPISFNQLRPDTTKLDRGGT